VPHGVNSVFMQITLKGFAVRNLDDIQMHGVEFIAGHVRATTADPARQALYRRAIRRLFFIFPRQKLQFYAENGRLDLVEP